MVKLLKYCLSIAVISIVVISLALNVMTISGSGELSNETYYHLTWEERSALSAEYTQLAKLLERGSPRNMRILEKAVVIDPNNDLAWRELAMPYLYNGMIDEWNAHMTKAVEIDPEEWQAWRGYQKLYFFRDYSGALFDFDATDTLTKNSVDYPQNISVDYLRGLCYLGLEQYDKSIDYFNKYIEDETSKLGNTFVDETAFLYLGIIANHQERYEDAIRHFNRAVEFETGTADVDYHKAVALLKIGEVEEAKELLHNAKKKFKDDEKLQAFYYEAIEELYINDIETLEARINQHKS